MQTPSRLKLDGPHDSICLRCLLTISARSHGEGHHGLELSHVCLPELLTEERIAKTGLKTALMSLNAQLKADISPFPWGYQSVCVIID